jgi:hypothetical protein
MGSCQQPVVLQAGRAAQGQEWKAVLQRIRSRDSRKQQHQKLPDALRIHAQQHRAVKKVSQCSVHQSEHPTA